MKPSNRIGSLSVVALLGAISVVACFGRTPVEGLGLANGVPGEECRQDGNCLPGLLCINSLCTDLADAPGPDATADLHRDDGSSECAGLVGQVALHTSVSGSTQGHANRYQGVCGGDEAPEDVWLLELTSRSDVIITTQGSGYDTLIYLRTGCDGGATELACNDDDHVGGLHSRIELVGLAAGRYYIFVDGFGTHSGNYQLNLQE